jgi:hypothetical protein
MEMKKELVQFSVQNNTNCDLNVPVMQQNIYSINATTKYSWNIQTIDISCGTGSIIINGISYSFTFTANSLTSYLSALNELGFGFFCTETISSVNYLYTQDDVNIYGNITDCFSGSTTSTTTSTTTGVPTTSTTTTSTTLPSTSTTTSTTTGVPTTSTTTTSTTLPATSTTTTTTTVAPTTSTTTTTTTVAPGTLSIAYAANGSNVRLEASSLATLTETIEFQVIKTQSHTYNSANCTTGETIPNNLFPTQIAIITSGTAFGSSVDITAIGTLQSTKIDACTIIWSDTTSIFVSSNNTVVTSPVTGLSYLVTNILVCTPL